MGESLNSFRSRTYLIDRVEGPTAGAVEVVAKDLFSKIEERKAVAPKPSNGRLSAGINNSQTTAVLVPAGIGNLEYSASGWVRIGSEVMSFTRSGDNLTIARAQLNTAPATHDADDLVQLGLAFVGIQPHSIVSTLLTVYSSVPSSKINSTEWAAEGALLPELYTGYVFEPTPVNDLIGELSMQAGFTVWHDVDTNMIKLQVLRPFSPAIDIDDASWIIEGTLSLRRQTQKRVSRTVVNFGQIDPTKQIDDVNNFRATAITIDALSEGPNQYDSAAIKTINSRWIPAAGRTFALNTGARITSIYRDPPIESSFELIADRYNDLKLGQYFTLRTSALQDDIGAIKEIVQLPVELRRMATRTTVRAQQINYTAGFPETATRKIFIQENQKNVNLKSLYDSLYASTTGVTSVIFEILSGIVVSSASINIGAIETGFWPGGITINLVNKGKIFGKGGNGGQGGGTNGPAQNGTKGGDAIVMNVNLTIDNGSGLIAGAGGGGGGGAGAIIPSFGITEGGGGGGGGSGFDLGLGGPPGLHSPPPNVFIGLFAFGGSNSFNFITNPLHGFGSNGSRIDWASCNDNGPFNPEDSTGGSGGDGGGLGLAGSNGGASGLLLDGLGNCSPALSTFFVAGSTSLGGAAGFAIRRNGFTPTITAGNNGAQIIGSNA
jgi:hypothetical protein